MPSSMKLIAKLAVAIGLSIGVQRIISKRRGPRRRSTLWGIFLGSFSVLLPSQERPFRLIGAALATALHVFSCLVTRVVGARHVTHVAVRVVF